MIQTAPIPAWKSSTHLTGHFFRDMAAPEFYWKDVSGAVRWLVTVDFGSRDARIATLTDTPN